MMGQGFLPCKKGAGWTLIYKHSYNEKQKYVDSAFKRIHGSHSLSNMAALRSCSDWKDTIWIFTTQYSSMVGLNYNF